MFIALFFFQEGFCETVVFFFFGGLVFVFFCCCFSVVVEEVDVKDFTEIVDGGGGLLSGLGLSVKRGFSKFVES